MSDGHWLEITSVCGLIGSITSTVANAILFTLLVLLPPKTLGAYKYLMIAFCVFGVFYYTFQRKWRVGIRGITLIHIYDNTIFVIQRKRFDYSNTTARAISSTYCGCYAMSFTLVAVHFIYRYFAVCKPENLKYFKNLYFALWLFAAVSVAFSWGFAAFLLYPETERTKQSFMHVITESYGLEPDSVGNVPYSYFHYEDGVEHLNPRNILGILQHGVIMAFSFGTVFFCGFSTYKSMNKHRGTSDRTRELQRQLFNALVMQTIIPTVLMYLPTTMLFVTPFLGLNIGCYGNITTVTVHLYPGIDPIVCLFIIRDFRRAVFNGHCFHRTHRRIYTTTYSASQVAASSGKI